MRKRSKIISLLVMGVFCGIICVQSAFAKEKAAGLAKDLANPLSAAITVPMQLNFDENIGPDEKGSMIQLNVQPVLPFTLNEDWYLISRTVIPLTFQDDIPVKGEGESGLGDVFQSFFLSPSVVEKEGWIWGIGPAMLLPTASDEALGTEKWSIGPTAVALKQVGPWTVGALANHIWSFAGDDDRDSVNSTYKEPWVSYVTSANTTVSLSIESTYDWRTEDWGVPVNFIVDQLFQIGEQYIQVGAAVKYWADSVNGGPQDFGFRLQMTFLFAK
jgi:hypothetical protein